MAEKEKNNAVINTERNSESSVTEQEKNKPVNNSTDNEPFTDGRKKGEWKSRYPDTSAKVFHVSEALYLLVLYIASFALFILNYKGFIVDFLNISPDKVVICTRMFYCCIAGLLGGTVFTTKWFYRSIARGYWNIDRIYWRFFTPLISLVFAFALGCILKENIIHGDGFSATSLGFLSGYFSDQAAGKMSEVATILFQTSKDKEKKDTESENTKNNEANSLPKSENSESEQK